ncbi:uncharacterized protein [Diadema setosum]|uniref:uncharacterized protein n=1 Tax=Diadema setosum TaxID=31175 RepID=UPI003B3A738D
MTSCMLQGKRFFCREWAFQKLVHGLDNRQASRTCGTLIMGGPGSGKTALCTEIVWPTSTGKQRSLNKRMLAYHFCQSRNRETLSVSKFILGLVNMITRSTLIHGYEEKLRDPSVQAILEPAACERNPDEAFKNGVLVPLCTLNPPSRNCFILVDSLDESYPVLEGDSPSGSRTIAELLANHHELFPPWLCLLCSARRQSKTVTRMFTGFRKLSLDDLRKSHVVRDVQQYILRRLDHEEAIRIQLSRDTAEMLNQLHIKSNGCIMYLEKVLDGVADGFISLQDITEIPGTLNGLYLWLCQRLFLRKQFAKVRPVLSVMLAAQCPLTESELYACAKTRNFALTREEFQDRLKMMCKILVRSRDNKIMLFHHSFAEWLLDVKYCTQKYMCSLQEGHTMLALRYTCSAPDLTPSQVQDFARNLLQAGLSPPLDCSHLALWLIWAGTPLYDCLASQAPKDQQVTQLLVSAGARVVDIDRNSLILQDALEKQESLHSLINSGASINQVDSNGRSLLANAAYSGNLESVQSLLIYGADVSVTDRTGQTALGLAARHGHVEVVALLLSHDAEVDHVDHDGWTPLRSAAWAGHTDVVTTLLNKGAIVDCSDHNEKRTALRAAAWGGHADIVHTLIEHGANVNQADHEGRTALIAAAYMGHSEIVEYLVTSGAEINHEDFDGRTALSVAAMSIAVNQGHTDVVTLLIEKGAAVDHRDHEGMSPLLVAAYEGHQTVVELLLEGGADVDHTDNNNRTALIVAASMGHPTIVRTLLYWGAAVDTIDGEGRTVLSIAASQGNCDIVRMLLERGLDEMHKDNHGWTPLHMCAYEGHQDVCLAILEQGPHVTVDIADRDGRTPMILAAQEGHMDCVKILLVHGASVTHCSHDGRTAMRAAASEGHQDLVLLLLQQGAEINYRDAEGRSSLYMLALENKLSMAQFFLENGADTELADTEGRTALHVASWQGHSEMVSLILDHNANPNAVDKERRSVLQSAAWQGHVSVAQVLLQKGADINHTCNQGASALCIAAQEGHVDIVKALLHFGANPNHADEHGRTPMKVALKGGHDEVSKLLEEYGVHNPLSPPSSRASSKRSGSSLSSSNSDNKPSMLTNGALLQGSSPSNSPDSTYDKRKSCNSNPSTKSSSNLTNSTNNSCLHLSALREQSKMTSFTEQLQQHMVSHKRAPSPRTCPPDANVGRNGTPTKITPTSSFQTIPENITTAHSSEQLQGTPRQSARRHQSNPPGASRRSTSPAHMSSRSSSPSVHQPRADQLSATPSEASPLPSPRHSPRRQSSSSAPSSPTNSNEPKPPPTPQRVRKSSNPLPNGSVQHVVVHNVQSASPSPTRRPVPRTNSQQLSPKIGNGYVQDQQNVPSPWHKHQTHMHLIQQHQELSQQSLHRASSLGSLNSQDLNTSVHNTSGSPAHYIPVDHSPRMSRKQLNGNAKSGSSCQLCGQTQPSPTHATKHSFQQSMIMQQNAMKPSPVHHRSSSQPVSMTPDQMQAFARKASLPGSFNQINIQRLMGAQNGRMPGSPEPRTKRNGICTNPKYQRKANHVHGNTGLHSSQGMLNQPEIITNGNGLSHLEMKQAVKVGFEGSSRNGYKKETPL